MGTDLELQLGRRTRTFRAGQKDRFRELLRKQIAEREIEFIGEETKHGEPSIAHEVCTSEACRYANIEIRPDERAERMIPTNYEADPKVPQEQKTQFHQQREEYMFRKSIAEAGNAQSIMVICGRNHTPALARRFHEAGHEVDAADIQSESWYVEDWMEHMMRI